ncbi:MAG: hypothetical protein WCI95_03215 [bacterium]
MKPALIRITRRQVESAISCPQLWADRAVVPTYLPAEWDKDHRDYVIGVILPSMRLPLKVRRIAVEAYLAGMELRSDGSSVIPDEWNWKDIWGVTHDYIFMLHRCGLTDAFDHEWGLLEANTAYRQGWIASGRPFRGWAWWVGLTAGSWWVWYR